MADLHTDSTPTPLHCEALEAQAIQELRTLLMASKSTDCSAPLGMTMWRVIRSTMMSLALLAFSLIAPLTAHAAWQTPNIATQTIAENATQPAPGVTATITDNSYFKITGEDVGNAVAEQLRLQAVEQKAQVNMAPGTPPILYSADHALKIAIHALQIDPQTHHWQGQLYVLSNGKTEIVKPVAGTYEGMIDVPVLNKQVGKNDVIEASDIGSKAFLSKLVRKDMVTDPKQLIGQSPRMTISADRPIRQSEISSPILVKKGQPVEVTYTSPYMSLKVTGVALSDGAKGDMIRVKNDKSEKAVSGRVAAAGRVETNATPAM